MPTVIFLLAKSILRGGFVKILLANSSKVTNDNIARNIYSIYKFLIDNGLNSHLNDFITKYSSALTSKCSPNLKMTILWFLGKVISKTEYKSSSVSELVKVILKFQKGTNDANLKNQSFNTLSKIFTKVFSYFI